MRSSAAALACILVVAGADTGRAALAAASEGTLTENLACRSDPSQTYTLFLPGRPAADPGAAAARRPVLLVFDPRGRGTMAASLFRDAASRYGWIIVSSNNTRSDGPWEPNEKALQALWPEIHDRYAIDERRIYAAGFSGGATVAWVLSRATHGLAGIIESGSPETPLTAAELPQGLAVFTAAGSLDFNHVHARPIDAKVAAAGHPHRLEFFPGPHSWMPPPMASRAIDWLELVAMRAGLRPPAPDLEAALTRALDVPEAAASDDPAGRRVDARELAAMTAVMQTLEPLRRGADMPLVNAVANDLHLDELHKSAQGTDAVAQSDARVLEFIAIETSFYLPQELADRRDYNRAAFAVELAARIHPDRGRLWVELAAWRAMAHERGDAIKAVERAVAAGNADCVSFGDSRFDWIRDQPAFQAAAAKCAAGHPKGGSSV